MRIARSLPLALLLVLAACKSTTTVVPAGKSPKPVASAAASTAPGTAATATPSVAPVATPAAPLALLQKPAGESQLVHGVARVDASYLGSKLATRLISEAGGAQIALDGTPLLANNGAGLISEAGGAVIANNGAGLIGKIRYRLAEALDVGTVLPVAGMVVQAVSLHSGRPLSLGTDAQGQPVYAVYTGPGGKFDVYLPPDESANVLFKLTPPAGSDPKLAYNLVAAPAQADQQVDEDTSQVAAYMHLAFATRLEAVMTGDFDALMANLGNGNTLVPAVRDAVVEQLRRIREAADAANVKDAPLPASRALADRLTGIALAHMDLDAIMINVIVDSDWGSAAPAPAIATLREQLRVLREAARAKLAANPHYFDTAPYVIAANACKAPAEQYHIEKPSDVGDLVVREYFSNFGATLTHVNPVWADLVGSQRDAEGLDAHDRFVGAAAAIGADLFTVLLGNVGNAQDECVAAVGAFDPAAPLTVSGFASQLGGPACPMPSP